VLLLPDCHPLQLKKGAQQLIRLNDVAATVSAVGINDPAPAISGNGAAIAHDQPAAESLSAMTSQYFIGGMMPELVSPVQQPQTIIAIGHIEGAGSVLKGRALSRTEPAETLSRVRSIMPRAARNLVRERFAYLAKTALSRADCV
jgi:hypothetical protein